MLSGQIKVMGLRNFDKRTMRGQPRKLVIYNLFFNVELNKYIFNINECMISVEVQLI